MHIGVIGAGITGLTTCRALLRDGHQVTLFDSAEQVASGASAQNGAQLSYAYVAPLSAPGLLPKLPSLLMSPTSPLTIRLGLNASFARWSWQFLRACTRSRLEQGTANLLALAEASRVETDAWLKTQDPLTLSHARNGKLVLFSDTSSFAAAQAQVLLQAKMGSVQQVLSTEQCIQAEPAVAPHRANVVGGVLTMTDEVADCFKVCQALLAQLKLQSNFQFVGGASVDTIHCDGTRITGIEALRSGQRQSFNMDAYVVCAGIVSAALLKKIGVNLAVLPLKGYSIDIPAASLARLPALSVTDTASKIVFAPLLGHHSPMLRVAGFAELNQFSTAVNPDKIAALSQKAVAIFGVGQEAFQALRPWGGLRPMSPDSVPFIGRVSRFDNLYVNAGQGALGFTLSFGSAAMLASKVSGKRID